MPSRVTSIDVARLAGVSQPTVSRALRNLPGASPATRDRVLAAARELSYVARDAGRVLSTQRTRRVAVVAAEMSNPYYPELVEPIRRRLADQGYRIVVVAEDGADVVVDTLADGSYDGVVLTTTRRRSRLPRDLTERGVPHVLVNRSLDYPESETVCTDNADGARQIAALLASLGHVRIGSVQGLVETSTGRERAAALRAGLRARGIVLRRELTRRVEFTHDAGHEAASDLLSLREPPTAIVAGNDVVALGVLSAVRRLGLRVPDDLTVIGFDDIAMASWPLIDLTTVSSDLSALACAGVDLLVAQMSGRGPAVNPVVRRTPATLVLRGTHGRRE
jgi:LacI family transcriptional regulator